MNQKIKFTAIFILIIAITLTVIASFSMSKYAGETGVYQITVSSNATKRIFTVSDNNPYDRIFTAPFTGSYYISAWGGDGGKGADGDISTGALGGVAVLKDGIIDLVQGDVLYVYIGNQGGEGHQGNGATGGDSGTNSDSIGSGGKGGEAGNNAGSSGSPGSGGGGGAATLIYKYDQINDQKVLVLVAGGGGGGGGGSGNVSGGPVAATSGQPYSSSQHAADSTGENGKEGKDGLAVFEPAAGGGGGGGGGGYDKGGKGGEGGGRGSGAFGTAKSGKGGYAGKSFSSNLVFDPSGYVSGHVRFDNPNGCVVISYIDQ